MTRSTEEWIGKTDDTAIPPRVKLRVFEKYKGKCYISGQIIRPGDKWDCDHIVALVNGGENRESNLAPALIAHHKQKTKKDVAIKSKTNKIKMKHLGIKKKKKSWGYGKNDKFKKKIDGSVVER